MTSDNEDWRRRKAEELRLGSTAPWPVRPASSPAPDSAASPASDEAARRSYQPMRQLSNNPGDAIDRRGVHMHPAKLAAAPDVARQNKTTKTTAILGIVAAIALALITGWWLRSVDERDHAQLVVTANTGRSSAARARAARPEPAATAGAIPEAGPARIPSLVAAPEPVLPAARPPAANPSAAMPPIARLPRAAPPPGTPPAARAPAVRPPARSGSAAVPAPPAARASAPLPRPAGSVAPALNRTESPARQSQTASNDVAASPDIPARGQYTAPRAAAAPGRDFSPSFDCARATSWVNHLVCNDERLAALDVEMSNAYGVAISVSSPPLQRRIDADQAYFLRQRARCRIAACVEHAYRIRIDELSFFK